MTATMPRIPPPGRAHKSCPTCRSCSRLRQQRPAGWQAGKPLTITVTIMRCTLRLLVLSTKQRHDGELNPPSAQLPGTTWPGQQLQQRSTGRTDYTTARPPGRILKETQPPPLDSSLPAAPSPSGHFRSLEGQTRPLQVSFRPAAAMAGLSPESQLLPRHFFCRMLSLALMNARMSESVWLSPVRGTDDAGLLGMLPSGWALGLSGTVRRFTSLRKQTEKSTRCEAVRSGEIQAAYLGKIPLVWVG